MSDHTNLRNTSAMKDELNWVFDNLKKNNIVHSNLWLIIKQPGVKRGQWTTDNLVDFLKQCKKETSDTTVHATLCASRDNGKLTTEDILAAYDSVDTEVSAINLSDFIWQCCQKEDMIYSHLSIMAAMIINYPFIAAIGDDTEAWITKTRNSMKLIHQATRH